jgi:2-isopropylmalate synthase
MADKNKQTLAVYDTTLRDGTQGSGMTLSVEDKVQAAMKLDELRFDYIEGGWPGSNPKDIEFFKRIQQVPLKYAKIAAFGSTGKKDTPAEQDANLRLLIESNAPAVTIFGKTSPFQVKEALQTTPQENLRMIGDSVGFLKKNGREVIYDAEHFFDGFEEDASYAICTLRSAFANGANYLVMCDTNGGTDFPRLQEIVREVRKNFPQARLGIHAHNDMGYGVANSMAAVFEGVNMVQGTVNGIGERVGNANLVTIIANIFKNEYPTKGNIDVAQLKSLSNLIYELANLPPDIRQPYVGDAAFAHKGGVHVDAVLKNPKLYEHIAPETFGNQRHFLVSDLAGTAHVESLEKFGIKKKDPLARQIVDRIKQLEHEGYSFEAADGSLELLIRGMRGEAQSLFELVEYRTEVTRKSTGGNQGVAESVAVVRLRVNGDEVTQMGYGDGPVNALDVALRAALTSKYPELAGLQLADYKVRIIPVESPDHSGTAARVRVLIESRVEFPARQTKEKPEPKRFGTVGVHDNIVEASWHALVESYQYAHLLIRSQK